MAETREQKQIAQWYVSNGIAKICNCTEGAKTRCADCDKKAAENAVESSEDDLDSMKVAELKALADEYEIEYPANVKKDILVALIKEARDVEAEGNA